MTSKPTEIAEVAPLLGGGDKVQPIVVLCFLINATMGLGFLSFPYAFMKSGIFLGAVGTGLVGIVATLCALYVVVAMANFKALAKSQGSEEGTIEINDIGGEKVELARMIYSSFGPAAHLAYTVCLSVSLVGTMWSYCATIASSLATMLPLWTPQNGWMTCDIVADESDSCTTLYREWLILSTLMLLPMCVVDLKHQAQFQIVMTGARFVLIAAIMGDCLRLALSGQMVDQTTLPEARPVGIPRCLAVAFFAMSMQTVVPEAMHDLVDKPKNANRVIVWALGLCMVVYLVIGITVASVFGPGVYPVATLTWHNLGNPDPSALQLFFRTLMVTLPVLDLTAAFPLCSVCLGDNMRTFVASEDPEHLKVLFRILAACMPACGAFFLWDVSQTLASTGVLVYFVCVAAPQIVAYASIQQCLERWGTECYKSPFWGWHCNPNVILASMGAGAVLFLAALPGVFKVK
eukprot:CAMPEP_0204402144 /NCGR_PEP_ID=MMETSP0470-20130426/5121_1 /ASSEMBLY_ACC=CAM_ASM_000385 /TAXON_ID=2969 /ORGANISM="Oxyrrhis marina" /LENGTH=461 /DNA_ID=CAMNT_0051397199 /DNA_START=137 /DNA_END=1520 /DNA_ORIENTATION=+